MTMTFCAAVLTAGCAPSVHLPTADTALPAAFEAPASPSVDPISLDLWWRSFNDAQLSVLIETALERSTTARLALARLQEARAARSVTRAGTQPTGSLSATATEQGARRLWGQGSSVAGSDSYAANFYPSWELDLFGRLSATRERADVQYASSTLDYHAARLALAADVATALFEARSTAIDLATARERLTIARDLARTARLGETHGLTSGQDRARLDSDVASASAQEARLTAELQASKRSLLILIGDPDGATGGLNIDPSLGTAPVLPQVTPGLLLARRPDVLSAGLAVEAASLGVQIDRLALFPKFDINPGVGLTAATGAGGGGTGLWSIAAGLALPILDRTRLMAQLRVSEAQGRGAVITYEQTVQNAFGETENALVRLSANRSRIGQLESAELDARRAYDIGIRGYRAGLTDLTTVLQSEQSWLQARAARDAGRLALLVGTVTAVRSLGGGWDASESMPKEAARLQVQGNN